MEAESRRPRTPDWGEAAYAQWPMCQRYEREQNHKGAFDAGRWLEAACRGISIPDPRGPSCMSDGHVGVVIIHLSQVGE